MDMIITVGFPQVDAAKAAGISNTGKVGTFGGTTIPPVTIFMVGLEKGIQP